MIALISFVVLLYLAYALYFTVQQRAILFPRHLISVPVDLRVVPGLERLWLATSHGKVEAWFLPPLDTVENHPAPLIILAHGNGDLIDRWITPVAPLREMGVGVLLVEFPGYGRSEGTPTYASIRETFLLAYDTIIRHPKVDPQRVLLYGRSIGGGAISLLAAERPSVGMILVSTFTSIAVLANEQWLPTFVVADRFDNLTVVQQYPHPLLVLHGTQDRTIPYHHGVALHAAAQRGEMISLNCGHNDCIDDWTRYWHDLTPFFAKSGFLK